MNQVQEKAVQDILSGLPEFEAKWAMAAVKFVSNQEARLKTARRIAHIYRRLRSKGHDPEGIQSMLNRILVRIAFRWEAKTRKERGRPIDRNPKLAQTPTFSILKPFPRPKQ